MKLTRGVLLAFSLYAALGRAADSLPPTENAVITETGKTCAVYRGTKVINRTACTDEEAVPVMKADAIQQKKDGNYKLETAVKFFIDYQQIPVAANCEFTKSAPVADAGSSSCLNGVQQVTFTSTFHITKPAVNGGSCPVAEGQTEVTLGTQPCTMPTTPIPAVPSSVAPGTTSRVQPYTTDNPANLPSPSDVGSFRLHCGYSHMAFDDPIVFPGQLGKSHLHTFFGNGSVNANSTTESLLTANSSTCAGGTANQSAYWTPAIIDTATMKALAPTEFMVYYKKGYNGYTNAEITNPPNGLRFVGGRSATATQFVDADFWIIARFSCDGVTSGTIPPCPAGHELHLQIEMPNCWDGKNLDSPDHRSHMWTTNGSADRRCPASHPVPIPQITINQTYIVGAGANASQYRLSSDRYSLDQPGGISFHGDVWLAWNEDIKAAWMKNCINAGFDCHDELLGDGRVLY